MTTGPSYERVYDRLKAALPDWQLLLQTPLGDISALIVDAGLVAQRTIRLVTIAQTLARDFGTVALTPLAGMSDQDAFAYLTTLPGVGPKSAKCVLMYSLGREVLPVDTHTARLAFRLGLVATASASVTDRELEQIVPPPLRYDFHVNALSHGRQICRALRPQCGACVLARMCPSAGRGGSVAHKQQSQG
jgi:endonuclease-3